MEEYNIDFSKALHIYFIGIGGVSMSGLARILISKGCKVSGSDACESEHTRELKKLGINVYHGHSAENIEDDIDCTVYTAAIKSDNPELVTCINKGIPTLSRAGLLGQLMKNYIHSIAVSGTHGKTSTTSMLAHILLEAELDPTISVGGILKSIGGNIRIGSGDVFLTEACEYTNSFLELYPSMELITNIEPDHLDFFKDIDDIRQSFRQFVERMQPEGILIINDNIDNRDYIVGDFQGKIIGIGGNNSYIRAENISYDSMGNAVFNLLIDAVDAGRITLLIPGRHNVDNALMAIGAGLMFGIDIDIIKQALLSYTGVDRRFEIKGKLGDITIIDDYAHHPQEIEATLKAAMHFPHKKLYVVFQPHTYSRTKALLQDFANVLEMADVVVLTDIYAAREKDTLGVSSDDIRRAIDKNKCEAYYLPSFDEAESFLLGRLDSGDVCITMGAGDIVKLGESLLGIRGM